MARKQEHLTREDMRVMSRREWARLNGISWETARQLFKDGKGPRTIQMSPNRVGVRVRDNREWQEQRLRD
jgi:predicted DNA-binding transcriptional regulator AlpA